MINVLFVCLGNICRSPMADAVFAHLVKQAGLDDKIRIDSAGTSGWHVGEPAHRGTLAVLKKHHIPYNGRARQFTHQDANQFDYILAMDRSNLSDIKRLIGDPPNTEVAMFLSYANQAGLTTIQEVPDPYYNNNFDEVYDLVFKGCQALLDHIRKTHDL
ncbi:MAG: low molecular weight protein-tyrosine-phosphatase [Phototrophicales bacterium]